MTAIGYDYKCPVNAIPCKMQSRNANPTQGFIGYGIRASAARNVYEFNGLKYLSSFLRKGLRNQQYMFVFIRVSSLHFAVCEDAGFPRNFKGFQHGQSVSQNVHKRNSFKCVHVPFRKCTQ